METELKGASGRKGKLAGEMLAGQLRELVARGLSLAEVRTELGIEVSREALRKRIGELGLTLKRRPFGAAVPPPAIGRRVSGAEMTKYVRPTRKRDEAWLSIFKQELDELLSARSMTYAQIWDELQRRHPFVPQLAAQTTARDKSLRISVWVARQREKHSLKVGK